MYDENMTNTETYTADELRQMIANATDHIKRGTKLGLRQLVISARRDRRKLRDMLEEMTND